MWKICIPRYAFEEPYIRQNAFAGLRPGPTPIEELTALCHKAVFKGEGGNWFKPSPKNVGNSFSKDAF